MKKRLLALIIGAAVTASVLAGCGGSSSGASSSAAAGGTGEAQAAEEEAPSIQIEGVESADAPQDEKTLVVHLNVPDSGFAAVITSPIVPKDAQDLAANPIGTGPFQVTEVEEQDYIQLSKFEDYWGEKAHLDSVTLKYFENTSELATSYIAGAIDGFNSNSNGARELEGQEYVENTRHSNSVQLLALNNAFEPFKDVRVRQAVAYALDADDIIETVGYGHGTKSGTPVIPALEKYYNADLAAVYDVNVDKARELLKEAGQEDLAFTVRVPSNYQVHMDTAQVIVNQLAKAGITMEIEAVDWSTWLEKVYTGREFEATIVSVDGNTAFPTSFLSRYVSDASNNFVNFNSEEYDKVYGEAVLCADDAEQVKLFMQAQQILSDECASVFIQDIDSIIVNRPTFAGFKSYPLYVDDYSAMYAVDGEESREGGDFIKGVSTEVSNFDPFVAQTADARSIFFNIYDGLLNTETDGSFIPAVAESYEVSDDLQTWTFTLRDGVKFHNGAEVTMDDVLFSIESAIKGKITGFAEIDSFAAQGTEYTVTYPEAQ